MLLTWASPVVPFPPGVDCLFCHHPPATQGLAPLQLCRTSLVSSPFPCSPILSSKAVSHGHEAILTPRQTVVVFHPLTHSFVMTSCGSYLCLSCVLKLLGFMGRTDSIHSALSCFMALFLFVNRVGNSPAVISGSHLCFSLACFNHGNIYA